jgi:hypothetical protein
MSSQLNEKPGIKSYLEGGRDVAKSLPVFGSNQRYGEYK